MSQGQQSAQSGLLAMIFLNSNLDSRLTKFGKIMNEYLCKHIFDRGRE